MISNATPWMYEHALYNGVATQSLRFDDGSSAYLSRTFSSGNRKTWTWSGWVKRSSLAGATVVLMYTGSGGGVARGGIVFNSSEQLEMQMNPTGSAWKYIKTNALHRDTSAWYHIVAVLDTTQATESNRQKFYVNGTEQTLSSASYPTLNQDYPFNLATPHTIGSAVGGGSYLDGYLSEVNFVDGLALDPTYFGETKNGVWIAKNPVVSEYGTNGFRLQFDQVGVGTASTSTIGADTSGKTNHLTSSGIVASDCNMSDSPENNWCTTNGIMRANITRSEGNLKMVGVGGNYDNLGTNFSVDVEDTEGWYWEYRSGGNDVSTVIGIAEPQNAIFNQSDPAGSFTNESDGYGYMGDGNKRNNNSSTSYGNSWTSGDIIGIAIKSGSIYFYKNGTIQNSGTSAFSSITGLVTPAFGINGTHSGIANFGQDSSFAGNETAQGNTDANGIGDFYYAPPSGYKALCTANLTEPTIGGISSTLPTDYFNTVLYTGTGSSQAITGVGFQPDFLWIKERNGTGYHALFDAVRGVTKALYSNDTLAEGTGTALTSFDSNGFTLSLDTSQARTNDNSDTYVSWNWKAGGTAVSNTDGSITSTVQANTDAGFSIVTWTGNATLPTTIGHGLGKQPLVLIVKNRDDASTNWFVHHHKTALGSTAKDYLNLNTTGADANSNDIWGQTRPTTSVFTVGVNNQVNGSGDAMIAYCFAEIEGYSKFGSYTGNGSADGTFVYTGFRPAFVLVKRTNSAQDWTLFDSSRNPTNATNLYLHPNNSAADGSGIGDGIDLVSNGFKMRHQANVTNNSGSPYIYMAFAENPFKYANAR